MALGHTWEKGRAEGSKEPELAWAVLSTAPSDLRTGIHRLPGSAGLHSRRFLHHVKLGFVYQFCFSAADFVVGERGPTFLPPAHILLTIIWEWMSAEPQPLWRAQGVDGPAPGTPAL